MRRHKTGLLPVDDEPGRVEQTQSYLRDLPAKLYGGPQHQDVVEKKADLMPQDPSFALIGRVMAVKTYGAGERPNGRA